MLLHVLDRGKILQPVLRKSGNIISLRLYQLIFEKEFIADNLNLVVCEIGIEDLVFFGLSKG